MSEVSGAGNGSRSSERINGWHLLAHAVAFCVAAAIGGSLVYHSYPRFEAQTDTAGEAFWAFLTYCVIAAGIGPLITRAFSGRTGSRCARKPNALVVWFRDFSGSCLEIPGST
ncbi:MAG: hypothetical protein WA709_23275 [Stellaceae bacterium]